MNGPQLPIDQLRDGDILILEDIGELTHLGIAAGQAVLTHGFNSASNVTHAGLYCSADKAILEASGPAGLRRMPLGRKRVGYKFQAFRYTPRAAAPSPIPATVVEIATRLIQLKITAQAARAGAGETTVYTARGGGGSYDSPGALIGGGALPSFFGPNAIAAIEALATACQQDETASNLLFYCSSFVTSLYQLAEMRSGVTSANISAIRLDYRHVSVKTLQGFLRNSVDWTYVGNYLTASSDQAAQNATSVWSPDVFTRSTAAWGMRPEVMKELRVCLENYHGIPYSSQNNRTRRELLRLIGTKVREAIGSDAVGDSRKPGLDELLHQIQYELWDFRLDSAG